MEAHQLRTFVAVVRHRGFSAAAAELGYTQAAVSQQIAALEADLKTQLLTRRPVTPTEAGARLLEHAEPILLRLAAARHDIISLVETPQATLAIGATPLAGASRLLADALTNFRHRMPRLQITLQTSSRQALPAAVARGEIDLALTDGLTAPGDPLPELAPVTAIGLSQEPVMLILPSVHPLATRKSLNLQDLVDARWVAADNVAPPLAEIRRLAGVETGFTPAITYTGQDIQTLIRLAAAGHGLTLLPRSVPREKAATAVEISQPRLCHRLELIHAALPGTSPASALAAILGSPG